MGFHKVPNLLVAGTLGVGGLVGWLVHKTPLPTSQVLYVECGAEEVGHPAVE